MTPAPGCGTFVGAVSAEIGPGTGAASLRRLVASGALALRPAGDALYLVGAGAHPIGGDELRVRLDLAARATAVVRSVGATLARRGAPGAGASRQETVVEVGDRACLVWAPEPGIAATGACHEARSFVSLSGSARLSWLEELVLGRHGEDPVGSWTSALEVRLDGRPILVTELGLGPAHPSWGSSATFAGATALAALVLVDPALPVESFAGAAATATATDGAPGVVLPLAGPGVEILAWGATLPAARATLSSLAAGVLAATGCAWTGGPAPSVSRPGGSSGRAPRGVASAGKASG